MTCSDVKKRITNQIFDQLLAKFENRDFLRITGDDDFDDLFSFGKINVFLSYEECLCLCELLLKGKSENGK